VNDVNDLRPLFPNYKELKRGVIRLYKLWVLEETKDKILGKSSTQQQEQ
jgi:hypothetical protein